MSKRDPVYPIYSKKELSALASSARIEIIDVLAQMGTVSVAELAATLGRAADTLYYHLRILQKAGLVVDCGTRVTQGRSEALYRARNLIIDYENARQKELWSARKAALLTKKQVGEVNELIWKLLNSVSTGPEGGQLYGITILLTPLNRQRRTDSKKKSGQKKAAG
jgi:DNA-binding transcriptional ArsR family regulator